MGRADYYAPGDYNASCFECGKKFKASTMKKHWQGYHVCRRCWEPRQPQDFVRAVADVQTPAWVQPVPGDRFIWESTPGLITTDTTLTATTTTVNGGTAVNGGINGDGVITITLPATPTTAQRIEIGNVGAGTVVVEGSIRKDTTVYPGVKLTPRARIWLVWGGTYWGWENEIRYSATTTYIITAVAHATWNPLDKGEQITLSNGNLTADFPFGAQDIARSTISKTSGKWYWEYYINNISTDFPLAENTIGLGIATNDASLGIDLGDDFYGWAYRLTTGSLALTPIARFHASLSYTYGTVFTEGDTIGVALDMDSGSITFYLNNVAQGVAYTDLLDAVSPIFAAIGVQFGDDGIIATLTANFGATTFAYSPPAGYDYGLYTETIYVWYLV